MDGVAMTYFVDSSTGREFYILLSVYISIRDIIYIFFRLFLVK